MKEKEKAYDEAIEGAKKYYGNRIAEEIFFELNEDNDKKIKKAILDLLKIWRNYKDYVCGVYVEDAIAWLEKQGEQNPCMIQWKGDNLKEVIGFTGKDKNFEKWFKSFEEYEKYVHEHNDIFKLFNENGNHYEIPVGAWIVKTPDGYNIASNAVLKQKSANKIEPKFKVGNWVVNKFGDSWHIDSFDNKNYQVSNGKGNYNYFPISKQDEMYLWTIQDAKDGDMLSFYTEYRGNKMFQVGIIKKYVGKRGGCSNTFKMYVGVNWDNNLQIGKYMGCSLNIECSDIHPATKEQRDFLFKKLKESGYKWNTETKTLEKLVEPKFKVGDKIVNLPMKYMGGSWTQGTISKITDDKYIFTDGSYTSISSQDSWKLVHDKKSKFDPKTLQPYDKVLIRRGNENFNVWFPDFVSDPPNNDNNKTLCMCVGDDIAMVIPYNDDTKHLISTTDEAPEYYRYWED